MIKDLTGMKFERLTVLKYVGKPLKGKGSIYACRCDCGNITNVLRGSLTSGNTKSCGCMHKEQLAERNFIHGKVKSPIYGVWSVMKDRCNNPKNKGYKNYGGRGIKVSESWQEFDNFHNDMISTYLKGLSVERKDVNRDYCKENCIWADRLTQANNTRRNPMFTVDGITDTMPNLARMFGLTYSTVQHRYQRGWEVDKIFKTPRIRHFKDETTI